MSKSSFDKKVFFGLLAIFLLGLILRLLGINHGYPFVFHPDEATIIRSALGIRFDINPAHFDWPHLYIYLNYFLYMAVARIRDLTPSAVAPILWDEPWIFYLLSRIFSATLGGLTVFAIYLSGRKLFNTKVGLWAALAFSITPFHVWHSHYALSDVPMVFFMAWGVYFAARILKDNKLRDYAFSGVLIGLSASTKYNGGLSAVMVPLATLLNTLYTHNYTTKKELITNTLSFRNFLHWSVSGIFAIIGFLIGTPFALFDFETFTRTDGPKGALWQFTNVGSVTFVNHITQFFNDILFKISDDLGYTILFGFIFVLFYALYKFYLSKKNKKTFKDVYSLTFVLTMGIYFLWYISGFEKSRSHYYMASYPFIALAFGYFINLVGALKNVYKRAFVYLVLLGLPLFLAIKGSYTFNNADTRVDLYNWLQQNQGTNMPVIYEFNDLTTIFEKLDTPIYRNGFAKISEYSSGILILTDGDTFDAQGYTLNLVYQIADNLKRGPGILVYTFEKQ